MEAIRETAFKAARQAGALLKERLGKIDKVDYKSAFNIVTDVDKSSENLIISIIEETFPNHQIVAEESGTHKKASSECWIIDPLDGTTNYAHGYPFFSVSIGFTDRGEALFGVVYNPITDEMFFAEDQQGAHLNNQKIKVSTNDKLNVSLLATGFPPDTKGAKMPNTEEFARITGISHGVRRDASAALDLSYVACGRLDGFWELILAPWDLAAGTLIVKEAGGTVTNALGGPLDLYGKHVIATNGRIHQELTSALGFANNKTFEEQFGRSAIL